MAQPARPASLHAILAAPAFLLLTGCDFDELMGKQKPVAGAKELAGSWACTGSDLPGATTYVSSLAVMKDGTATEVSTLHTSLNGKPAELAHMERMSWTRTKDGIDFKTTYRVVTKFELGGKPRDLGEANKVDAYTMQQHHNTLPSKTKIVKLTADRLKFDEPAGGHMDCKRKV